ACLQQCSLGGLLAVEEFAVAQGFDVVDQRPGRRARFADLAEHLVEKPADFVLFESHKPPAPGRSPPGHTSSFQNCPQKSSGGASRAKRIEIRQLMHEVDCSQTLTPL